MNLNVVILSIFYDNATFFFCFSIFSICTTREIQKLKNTMYLRRKYMNRDVNAVL